MRWYDSARAILDALRLDGKPESLAGLNRDALAFADRNQLTPLLALYDLPAEAREYAQAALERNAIRAGRVREAYAEIAGAFDHVVLKGFTHVPDFTPDPRVRVQYDLDLYVPREGLGSARNALLDLGYEPIRGMEGLAMDHLPTMVRKTGWEWRGDYYDPDIPVSVEVHFQFWDAPTERLYPQGLEDFWARREGHRLHPVDMLGYAALHLTRHLLRGDLRVFHVWELAKFLDTKHNREFWRLREQWHAPSLRRLEAVAFLLARRWFGCKLPADAESDVAALPPPVHSWFERYGWSPIEGMFRPNKRELWLHLSLAETLADRSSILRRRLAPLSLPGAVDAIYLPADRLTFRRRMKKHRRDFAHAASRGLHHLRLLAPTLWEGVRWWWRTTR